MKKVPTLFERDPLHRALVTDKINVLLPAKAIATVKYDGTCISRDVDGGWWARREVGKDRDYPPYFVKEDYDEVTGKTFGWVPILQENQYKWHNAAIQTGWPGILELYGDTQETRWTFEAVGPHFQGNPMELYADTIRPHGMEVIDAPTDYSGLSRFLSGFPYEGIVWWNGSSITDGLLKPVAKIKRRDFGYSWPVK